MYSYFSGIKKPLIPVAKNKHTVIMLIINIYNLSLFLLTNVIIILINIKTPIIIPNILYTILNHPRINTIRHFI